MGGRALNTSRMDAITYHALASNALASLGRAFPSARATCVPSYFTKSDFGDVDILVEDFPLSHPGGLDEACTSIASLMGASDWIMNCSTTGLAATRRMTSEQGVMSMAVEVGGLTRQLDLIFTSQETYDMTLAFMSFNMLGNLISSQAHTRNMFWGASGLMWRDPAKRLPRVVVTRDPLVSLEFLGYDTQRFKQGFNTLEDVFDFASSCPDFDPRVYELSRKTSKERRRDAVRVNYMAFLDYLDHKGFPEPPPRDMASDLAHARTVFPEFAARLDQALLKADQNERVDRLISRAFFIEVTGLLPDEAKRFRADFLQEMGGQAAVYDLVLQKGEGVWRQLIESHQKGTPMLRRPSP